MSYFFIPIVDGFGGWGSWHLILSLSGLEAPILGSFPAKSLGLCNKEVNQDNAKMLTSPLRLSLGPDCMHTFPETSRAHHNIVLGSPHSE